MIIDHLDRASQYLPLSPLLAPCLEFLRTRADAQDGRYDLRGDDLFAMVQTYDTVPAAEKQWEAHRRYVDLQVVTDGFELMGYAPLDALTVVTDHDDAKDVAFLGGHGSFVRLDAGMFAILKPQDAHMPGVCVTTPQRVRKVVFKLTASSFAK